MKRQKIAPEIKEQILNRIKNEGVSVIQAAKDHGIGEGTIYTWIAKRVDGGPTVSEIVRLKKENAQLYQLVGEITLRLSETQKKK
jgi:transposase-like protein